MQEQAKLLVLLDILDMNSALTLVASGTVHRATSDTSASKFQLVNQAAKTVGLVTYRE